MSQIKLKVVPGELVDRKQVFVCTESVFDLEGSKFVLISTEEYVESIKKVQLTDNDKEAIKDFIKLGKKTLHKSHKSYFSPGGWAYEKLNNLIKE